MIDSIFSVWLVACVLVASRVAAQRGPVPDPLVRENVTVKLADHTYVIPDGNVPLVPNVGVVVGSRGTLVIDPGLGRRNGETVLREVARISRNTEIYVATTHFHAEHTTGYLAFPATAKYVNSMVQEAEFAQGGAQQIQAFSGRSPVTAELLKDATGRKADITFDREYTLDLGGVRVRSSWSARRTRAATRAFRGRGRRPVLGRRRDEQLIPRRDSGLEHESVAGRVRCVRKMRPRTIVPSHGAVGERFDHCGQPHDHAGRADAHARTEGARAFSGRDSDDGAEGVPGHDPEWPRANGLAAAARAAYAEAP